MKNIINLKEIDAKELIDLIVNEAKNQIEINNNNYENNTISLSKKDKRNKSMNNVIDSLNELKMNLNHIEDKIYSLPENTKELFYELKSVIPLEKYRYIKNTVNSEINNYNRIKLIDNNIESEYDYSQKLLKKAINITKSSYLSNVAIVLKSNDTQKNVLVKYILPELKFKIESLYDLGRLKSYIIYKTNKKFELNIVLKKIESCIKNNKISDTDPKTYIVFNKFDQIKSSYIRKQKLVYEKKTIDSIINNLKVEEYDFLKTIKLLEINKNQISKEIIKLDKYLNKFDFDNIIKVYENPKKV